MHSLKYRDENSKDVEVRPAVGCLKEMPKLKSKSKPNLYMIEKSAIGLGFSVGETVWRSSEDSRLSIYRKLGPDDDRRGTEIV